MSGIGRAVNRPAIVIRRFRSALPLFWLLAAAAILLRGAIPAGWMPVAAQGGIRIAICTGEGPAMAMLGADGKLHREAPRRAGPARSLSLRRRAGGGRTCRRTPAFDFAMPATRGQRPRRPWRASEEMHPPQPAAARPGTTRLRLIRSFEPIKLRKFSMNYIH